MTKNIAERWNLPMRTMHWVHMITTLILIVTGFRIYLGWGFPATYTEARALHMVAVCGFLAANVILLPYGMILEALEDFKHLGIKQGIKHFTKANMFGIEDVRRLKAILLNFFGRQKEYPALTIYDEKKGFYVNRAHPITKILIVLEAIAIALITLTGIVMYDADWGVMGLNIGATIIGVVTWIIPSGVDAMAFCRTLHLGTMYYFIFDLFIHVGILQLDTKAIQAWKAMFFTGKEDLSKSPRAKIIKK
ncbi:MAG TPA: cytochrome B [Methanocellales archaeon]|nr:cytochrome B [Methanocellales archaeon]